MAKMFVCSKTEPIVQTKAGKLRGFILDGTYTFHGIKYADAKRFQMPTEVEPWDGVKDALSYGFVSPMLSQDTPNGEVMVPHRYWPMDENCQYLNVWTQTLDQDAKKPVLLWLHGGGFAAGSSIEQQAYDGENMSKYGDAVVVSLNHRLNILGYLDLSPFGEKYANSGNAGNADMVAALRWIHDNIAAFGGDPENVTIFGQSGGGMKVWTLMQTPSADGLFHKGVIQSGLIDGFVSGKKTGWNQNCSGAA
ncbi:MAG: carboxylesterase family protein [Neglectibacter timonensis]|uniref:carboxylesterase family protein n=1 Tax=Neglectibacter timonensis TaxID=1776382 RepID=UPI003993D340